MQRLDARHLARGELPDQIHGRPTAMRGPAMASRYLMDTEGRGHTQFPTYHHSYKIRLASRLSLRAPVGAI